MIDDSALWQAAVRMLRCRNIFDINIIALTHSTCIVRDKVSFKINLTEMLLHCTALCMHMLLLYYVVHSTMCNDIHCVCKNSVDLYIYTITCKWPANLRHVLHMCQVVASHTTYPYLFSPCLDVDIHDTELDQVEVIHVHIIHSTQYGCMVYGRSTKVRACQRNFVCHRRVWSLLVLMSSNSGWWTGIIIYTNS